MPKRTREERERRATQRRRNEEKNAIKRDNGQPPRMAPTLRQQHKKGSRRR